jgi:glycogen synthase
MHVCLLTLEWPAHGCGIGTYMFNLARGLVGAGHEVTVITHDRHPVRVRGTEIHGVPLPREMGRVWRRMTPWRLEPYHTWSLTASRCYARLAADRHFDIIETAEYGAWGRHLVGGKAAPMVVKCHAPTYISWAANDPEGPSDDRPFWLGVIDRHEKRQTACADAVVSPSVALAERLSRDWGMPRSRFAIIPNLIDADVFSPSPADLPQSREILYVGRLQYNKGCFDLADAIVQLFRKYPDIRVRFLGTDMRAPSGYGRQGDMASDVICATVPHEFQDRLLFTDHVPVSDVVEYYRGAICAVVPTRGFESFSYTVLEAMASGCPVVTTRCGGPEEIVTQGVDGLLVAPGDVETLTSALEALVADPLLRQKLAVNARATVERRFSIGAVVPQVAALYEKTISQSAVRRLEVEA